MKNGVFANINLADGQKTFYFQGHLDFDMVLSKQMR